MILRHLLLTSLLCLLTDADSLIPPIRLAIKPTDGKDGSKPGCYNDMYQCPGSGRCIPKSWLCDGESDCEDGKDEANCDSSTAPQCNPEKEYQCTPSPGGGVPPSTSSGHLMTLYGAASLYSHHCIPKDWVCDGEPDCVNKDDELGCKSMC
ncbi:low-density lipoprotein receptor domain class A domain-containing protein [Ditylenchus destructor]|nr:low-density lipoprotein receptor domain class A domain-containing protein [Ditylenchus destructor]